MAKVTCKNCTIALKKDMEIEYSQWLHEYFCSPKCAKEHYFIAMQSRLYDIETENDPDIKIKGEFLYHD